MSKHRKPESEPLGSRIGKPHAPDGWATERDHTTATGHRENDSHGFPVGDPNRDIPR